MNDKELKRAEIIAKLEKLQPEKETGWREHAEWRRENRGWLRYSQQIAVQMLSQMAKLNLNQSALAERMGCSQQYISKVLKGKENLSLETIAKIEQALDLTIIQQPVRQYPTEDNLPPRLVADNKSDE